MVVNFHDHFYFEIIMSKNIPILTAEQIEKMQIAGKLAADVLILHINDDQGAFGRLRHPAFLHGVTGQSKVASATRNLPSPAGGRELGRVGNGHRYPGCLTQP